MKQSGIVLGVLAALAIALVPVAASAQAEYPNRPIKMTVPFAAGGVVDVIGRLWACNTHLFPGGGLSLFASFRVFLDDHGLRLDDVPEICSRMLTPERRATHKFASDFFTDLAAIVAETVRRRRAEADQQTRRREDIQTRHLAASPRLLIESLRSQIGRGVEESEESA